MRLLLALLAVFFAAAPCASAANCDPTGVTDITVTQSGAAALATYRFAAPLSCLALGERGDVRKMTWLLQTAGATLSADGNTVQFAAPRTDFAVRLKPFDRDGALDRVYSPVIAFGDGAAVAVYSRYLYPAATAHGVTIAFDGFAPTAPQRPVGPQRLGIEQTYMIVGRPVLARRGNVAAVIDQAMPAWLVGHVQQAISQGETALREVSAAPRPLTYLVTYTDSGAPYANWRGDVLDTLVRLNFMGAQWQTSSAGQQDTVDNFVLHEMFHTASTPKLDPDLPGAMSLSEGGAEAGAKAMRRRFAPASAAASAGLTAEIDNAIGRCGDLNGATLLEKEQKSQQRAPYSCGMALQFMVAAAAGRDPLDLWRTMLARAQPLAAGWPDFVAAAAATATVTSTDAPNRAALAVLKAMTDSRADWHGGVAQLTDLGLLRRRSEDELAQAAFAARYRTAAIFHLLNETCRAAHGFNSLPGVSVLDAPPGTCGPVPDKFRLVTMNGRDLAGDAYAAYQELARRYAAQLPVVLGNDQGETVALACTRPAPAVVVLTLAGKP